MRLLLDTHVFLWMATQPERLGDALAEIEKPANDLFLSAASTWELAMKVSIGRLTLPEPVGTYVASRMRSLALGGLGVEHLHAAAVEDLPMHHRDPFDRLLVAQARAVGATLVTADEAMRPYDVPILWAR
jgi:PIN domain nuclease of toxin-antitoxin system